MPASLKGALRILPLPEPDWRGRGSGGGIARSLQCGSVRAQELMGARLGFGAFEQALPAAGWTHRWQTSCRTRCCNSRRAVRRPTVLPIPCCSTSLGNSVRTAAGMRALSRGRRWKTETNRAPRSLSSALTRYGAPGPERRIRGTSAARRGVDRGGQAHHHGRARHAIARSLMGPCRRASPREGLGSASRSQREGWRICSDCRSRQRRIRHRPRRCTRCTCWACRRLPPLTVAASSSCYAHRRQTALGT